MDKENLIEGIMIIVIPELGRRILEGRVDDPSSDKIRKHLESLSVKELTRLYFETNPISTNN